MLQGINYFLKMKVGGTGFLIFFKPSATTRRCHTFAR
jgi:hypothetical protein